MNISALFSIAVERYTHTPTTTQSFYSVSKNLQTKWPSSCKPACHYSHTRALRTLSVSSLLQGKLPQLRSLRNTLVLYLALVKAPTSLILLIRLFYLNTPNLPYLLSRDATLRNCLVIIPYASANINLVQTSLSLRNHTCHTDPLGYNNILSFLTFSRTLHPLLPLAVYRRLFLYRGVLFLCFHAILSRAIYIAVITLFGNR